jgi:hypothetical protein
MEIVYHIGAHCTDEDRIPKTLLKNRVALAEEGIVVPWPRQYRFLFRDLLQRLKGLKATQEIQDLILDSLMVQDRPKRVIFSHDFFLGLRSDVLSDGQFYPRAPARIAALRNLFPDNPVTFCLGVRSPVTFLHELRQASHPTDEAAFLGGVDPAMIKWSGLIARLQEAVPGSDFKVWCDEDTALLWPLILQTVSGHAPDTRLNFLFEFLAGLMKPEGIERMRKYFADHPPESEERRRRAVAAFLEKFGLPDQMEIELDFPGWTEPFVDAMQLAYDADIDEVAGTSGVTLVT